MVNRPDESPVRQTTAPGLAEGGEFTSAVAVQRTSVSGRAPASSPGSPPGPALAVTVVVASAPPTVTFTQDGEKVSGHDSSMTLGEADLTGTLKGQELTFNFNADLQGQAVPVTYTATVDSSTTMKGKIDIGGQATGTFTGKKQ